MPAAESRTAELEMGPVVQGHAEEGAARQEQEGSQRSGQELVALVDEEDEEREESRMETPERAITGLYEDVALEEEDGIL